MTEDGKILKTGRSGMGWKLMIAAALLCASGLLTHARIFKVTGGGSGLSELLTSVGGISAYKADITVNGRKGYLETMGTSSSFKDTAKALVSAYGKDFIDLAGDGMLIGSIEEASHRTKIFVVKMPDSLGTVIHLIRITEAKSTAPTLRPSAVRSLPSYPGSSIELAIEDGNTGMSLSFEKAPASAASVNSFMVTSMQNTGWELPIKKTVSANRESGMTILSRPGQNCVIHTMKDKDGGCSITLLHMPLKL